MKPRSYEFQQMFDQECLKEANMLLKLAGIDGFAEKGFTNHRGFQLIHPFYICIEPNNSKAKNRYYSTAEGLLKGARKLVRGY